MERQTRAIWVSIILLLKRFNKAIKPILFHKTDLTVSNILKKNYSHAIVVPWISAWTPKMLSGEFLAAIQGMATVLHSCKDFTFNSLS